MITGQEQPDEGSITVGETVKLGYVDQSGILWMPIKRCGKRFLKAMTLLRLVSAR